MPSCDYLFTTKPSEIQAAFVSDLHLSADTPRLTQAFIALINDLCQLPNLASLYILGDWLDAWLGDDTYLNLNPTDQAAHWLHPVITALKRLSDKQVQIFVMHGNRDFAIGQGLCRLFGGALIDEPFVLTTTSQRIRLEHGDALCTDDVAYQRYRAVIRHPVVRFLLAKLPLAFRQKLAGNIKNKSKADKAQKTTAIMDANADAIKAALTGYDVLLHGHTHRPAVHHDVVDAGKTRIVLGDWRDDGQKVQAEIGFLVQEQLVLAEFG
ncbi:UDP-2,3-diacylglucosamine diphosphatase [Moraxella marmotae]|uniref:UDP-2,3-diacylglucosamine diphosphatase n=1 Tax=Moraxella marmotae TaxID=3344520 RepID=UPI0035F4DE43